MSRAQRIQKLGNAIKRMRGLYNSATGKWHRAPDKSAIPDVVKWLTSLGVNNPRGLLKEIFELKSMEQFRSFMRNIGEPIKP